MTISGWPSSSRALYPSILYSRTHRKARRLPLKICRMEPARRRLVTRRYGSAQNKLGVIACNTFGWTPAVSINRTILSLQKLLTLCFAGTACRLNAMSICQICRGISLVLITWPGNRHFGNPDSSPEAGRFKSLLLRYQLNSSARNPSGLVVRVL
jgi:hypothetical protein